MVFLGKIWGWGPFLDFWEPQREFSLFPLNTGFGVFPPREFGGNFKLIFFRQGAPKKIPTEGILGRNFFNQEKPQGKPKGPLNFLNVGTLGFIFSPHGNWVFPTPTRKGENRGGKRRKRGAQRVSPPNWVPQRFGALGTKKPLGETQPKFRAHLGSNWPFGVMGGNYPSFPLGQGKTGVKKFRGFGGRQISFFWKPPSLAHKYGLTFGGVHWGFGPPRFVGATLFLKEGLYFGVYTPKDLFPRKVFKVPPRGGAIKTPPGWGVPPRGFFSGFFPLRGDEVGVLPRGVKRVPPPVFLTLF